MAIHPPTTEQWRAPYRGANVGGLYLLRAAGLGALRGNRLLPGLPHERLEPPDRRRKKVALIDRRGQAASTTHREEI